MATTPSGKKTAQKSKGSELVIKRIFDAPRRQVWNAWTEPERVKRWWGPEGFTCPFAKIDFRVGGRYLYCMRAPDGKDYWSTGEYHEIVPPERIVCTDSFADENGTVVPASYYGMPGDNWPLALLVTVTFDDQGDKTKFTLRHDGFPSSEMRDMAGDGWSTSLDKLANSLETEQRSGRT